MTKQEAFKQLDELLENFKQTPVGKLRRTATFHSILAMNRIAEAGHADYLKAWSRIKQNEIKGKAQKWEAEAESWANSI